MQVVHGNHEILPFVAGKLAFIKSTRKLRLLARWKAQEGCNEPFNERRAADIPHLYTRIQTIHFQGVFA
jgi:hypothetical protein